MAARGADSDGGSMTPSERSEGDERSDHDSDYETNDEEEAEDDVNIVWTGYGKKTPVITFRVDAVHTKAAEHKTVGSRYHLAFKFGTAECRIIRNVLEGHGFHEVHPNSSDFNIMWTGSHLKPFTLRSMSEFQKTNHFPRSYEMTRKDRLFKNIQRMQQIKGFKNFDIVPQSFIIPSEYQEFCAYYLRDKGPFIVKPVASSRGRGVYLVNHPDQVPVDENVIVSKYISNPNLIDNFKYDIRLYVAVTSYDPIIVYLYEEGLTRFATVKYEKTARSIRNQCMHLTNYSVNKKNPDFVKNDDANVEDYGNKWSLGALLRYLRSQGTDTAALMMRIEDIVIKTILSVELPIATACKMFMPYRGNCFELYGFDVLLDDNLKPWILEVNLSPSLACDAPIDMKIKSNLVCDLFTLIGLVCHDPLVRAPHQSRRNQEVTAKMSARAKSARLRQNTIASSVYNKQSPGSVKQRPQSAGSTSNASTGNKNLSGLNSDEIKIVRRLKEEDARKTGWVRIFPSPDSWDLYSSFLQYTTTHNMMLHQQLYPERHKTLQKPGVTTSVTSMGSRAKSIYQHLSGNLTKNDTEYAETYANAILRTRLYERKLGQRKSKNRGKRRLKKKSPRVSVKSKPKVVQGIPDDVEEDNMCESEKAESEADEGEEQEEAAIERQSSVDRLGTKTGSTSDIDVEKLNAIERNVSAVPATNVSTNQQAVAMAPRQQTIAKPPVAIMQKSLPSKSESAPLSVPDPKFNVVDMLQKGGSLSKVQARSAFAMYLVRVQQRLVAESGLSNQDDVESLNEQMDLVLRFLKRAANNLQQSFKVVVPSRKLSMNDRRRILAKQLGDFVYIYNKETEQLRSRRHLDQQLKRSESLEGLDGNKFDKFINLASESELEEVLTTYTKLNKSASIFLGTKNAGVSSRPSSGVQVKPGTKLDSMLTRRRESNESTADPPAGLNAFEEIPRIASAPIRGSRSESVDSLQYNTLSSGSFNQAVSIYSQKLNASRQRPASANQAKTANRLAVNRPSSAVNKRPISAFTTTYDPTVDTHNEKAIQDVLQRLALRQQARQYAAVNGSIVLSNDLKSFTQANPSSTHLPHAAQSTAEMAPPSHITSYITTSSTPIVDCSLINPAEAISYSKSVTTKPLDKPGRCVNADEQVRYRTRPASSGSHRNMTQPVKASSSVSHLQTANATFNSFIEDAQPMWQNDLAYAYNHVTGVAPQNYQGASVGSRQFQIAQQQQQMKQQRMLEQSKALLEQSKAKHQAMIAQVHAAQRSSVRQQGSSLQQQDEQRSSLWQQGSIPLKQDQIYAPKPPAHSSAVKKGTSMHRVTRVNPTDDVNYSFYNNIKYDYNTGQSKAGGK